MSDGPLSPEEVAHRGFGTTFRGFDTGEVRSYLQRVANELRTSTTRERELNRRLAEAEHRAAHPVLDRDTLTRALGEEMARILATAQEAAIELKAKAEENSARILREAHEQAQQIRARAEVILAERTEEADNAGAEIRRAAQAEAAGLLERAGREAAGALADVEARSRQLVQEAQTARARVVGDLTRRRKALQAQVEQLRAGRERLLEAYRVVRHTTDEVADELQRVEAEARQAAATAGERAAAAGAGGPDAEGEPAEELDDVLASFPGAHHPTADEPAPGGSAPGAAGAQEGVGPVDEAAVDAPAAEGPAAGAERPDPVATGDEPAAVEPAAQEAAPGPGDTGGGPIAEEPGQRPANLRLLRRSPVTEAETRSSPLDLVEAASEIEGVRIIGTGPGGEAGEGAGAGPDHTPPAGGAAPPVDELFARIRAGRADAVAKAREVLEDENAGGTSPQDVSGEGGGGDAVSATPEGAAGPEALLQRRDQAVEGIETRLARKLKRALQDEQNEVLDRVRSSRGTDPATVLPADADHGARYRRAAEEVLASAASAGAAFSAGAAGRAGREGGNPADVADLAGELAASLVEPLRRALQRALGGDAGADQVAVVERIGAAYRECKAQRVEGLAGDAVTAAFAKGALGALQAGAAARWVVDDQGRPCPDCDDNALAGPTAPGEAFPTGQAHPPAHAGCRCLIAPAVVAASVNGAG